MKNSAAAGGGISFSGVLFLIFMTLKLMHVIDWSWWWVTAPLWAPLALVLAFFAFILAICIFVGLAFVVTATVAALMDMIKGKL